MSLTSLVPLPYRILAFVLLAIALFGAGVLHGMKLGEADLDAYRVKEQAQTITAMAAAGARTRAMQAQKDEALHAATIRAQANARAAAAVRGERDGLRDDLAAALGKLSDASVGSVRQYAATLAAVFEQCVSRYSGVAQEADGHATDALTLEQAWPQSPPP